MPQHTQSKKKLKLTRHKTMHSYKKHSHRFSSNRSKIIILLLGAIGSLKNTCALYICSQLKIPHISVKDILHEIQASGSNIGKKIVDTLRDGKSVSDKIVLSAIEQRVQNQDCHQGFLLDDFPRNARQAKRFNHLLSKQNLDVTKVIVFDIDPLDTKDSNVERWTHSSSDKNMNLLHDKKNKSFIQRKDNTEKQYQKQVMLHKKNVSQILSLYTRRQISHVDVSTNLDNIYVQIKDMTDNLKHCGSKTNNKTVLVVVYGIPYYDDKIGNAIIHATSTFKYANKYKQGQTGAWGIAYEYTVPIIKTEDFKKEFYDHIKKKNIPSVCIKFCEDTNIQLGKYIDKPRTTCDT